jgi:transposase
MPSAVRLRDDFSAATLRALAKRSKDVDQSRRLLSLAAVRDGMDRASAAKIGGMDRQTLRDWVHRFNAAGPDGLFDHWTNGPTPRLRPEQLAELAAIVEAGPDRKKDGVVRWRRVDLKRVIAERFGVDYHPRYVGTLLRKMKGTCVAQFLGKPLACGPQAMYAVRTNGQEFVAFATVQGVIFFFGDQISQPTPTDHVE